MKLDAYRFWLRFDEIRGEKEIQDVVRNTDLKYRTLLAMRSNQSIPKASDLYQIASTLGTTMEYLLTGENSTAVYSARVKSIADACTKASDLELAMVEKILDIPPLGENTDFQKALS